MHWKAAYSNTPPGQLNPIVWSSYGYGDAPCSAALADAGLCCPGSLHDSSLAAPMRDVEVFKRKWREEQALLKEKLITDDNVSWSLQGEAEQTLKLVGGVDISFYPEPGASGGHSQLAAPLDEGGDAGAVGEGEVAPAAAERGVAALVVLTYPDLCPVYEDFEPLDMDVPYCPGFLAFREVPAYSRLLARAAATPFYPQVVLLDGCGVLHYQGFGAACHLGVAAGIPTVGVAKNLLMVDGLERGAVQRALQEPLPPTAAGAQPAGGAPTNTAATDLAQEAQPQSLPPTTDGLWVDRGAAGRCVPLVGASGAVLGAALRVATTKNPVYVSIGHRLSLKTAVELVWRCCKHRVPEPTRQADIKSRQYIREHPIALSGPGQA